MYHIDFLQAICTYFKSVFSDLFYFLGKLLH